MPKQTKKPPEILIEAVQGHGAKITRPDGTSYIVYNVSDMLTDMMYCSGEWPGCVMDDKRGWKFPGEA